MYRLHTCYKALGRALELREECEVHRVALEGTIAPCAMCQAWWRRSGKLLSLHASISTAAGTWKSDTP